MNGGPTTLGDWATIAIAKQSKKMLRYEKQVLAGKDPEQLHQMRVGARRLRSALTGFAPALQLPKAMTVRSVARIARQLGVLRDLDVLLGHLQEQYLPHLPIEEQERLQAVIRNLSKARKVARKRVRATLTDKPYRRLKKALRDWLQQPTQTAIAARPIEIVLPDLLLPLVSEFLLHPGWLIGAPMAIAGEVPTLEAVEALLAADEGIVHDLRKEAKRLRYQMELFAPFYDPAYGNWVSAIKAIQTILGELQDSAVAIACINKVLGTGGLERELPTLARLFREWRYRRWLQWQALQRFFLEPRQQQRLRACISQPQSQNSAPATERLQAEVLS